MNSSSTKRTAFSPAQLFQKFSQWMNLSYRDLGLIALGDLTMAFAISNIHIPAKITEGGLLGGMILIHRVFGGNPALISAVLDFSFYFLGTLLLSRGFLRKSIYSTLLYSFFFNLFDQIGPILPSLETLPFLAAILGGLLLGAGCGMVVSRGGAAGGDDCYALIVEKYTPLSLSQAYFSSDATVLFLSFLVYLPAENVLWSLLTTLISSYVVGQLEFRLPEPRVPVNMLSKTSSSGAEPQNA